MKEFLVGLAIMVIVIFAFIKATDRVCDKNFTETFKQTEQYKSMQCPQ